MANEPEQKSGVKLPQDLKGCPLRVRDLVVIKKEIWIVSERGIEIDRVKPGTVAQILQVGPRQLGHVMDYWPLEVYAVGHKEKLEVASPDVEFLAAGPLLAEQKERCLYEEEMLTAWNIWRESKGTDRRVCWWQYQAFFRRYQEHLAGKAATQQEKRERVAAA
jgi:hypothetical protein